MGKTRDGFFLEAARPKNATAVVSCSKGHHQHCENAEGKRGLADSYALSLSRSPSKTSAVGRRRKRREDEERKKNEVFFLSRPPPLLSHTLFPPPLLIFRKLFPQSGSPPPPLPFPPLCVQQLVAVRSLSLSLAALIVGLSSTTVLPSGGFRRKILTSEGGKEEVGDCLTAGKEGEEGEETGVSLGIR